MAIFTHRIHLPLRKLHEIEKDHQARDWFWLDGYESDLKTKTKKKARKQGATHENDKQSGQG